MIMNERRTQASTARWFSHFRKKMAAECGKPTTQTNPVDISDEEVNRLKWIEMGYNDPTLVHRYLEVLGACVT
jgi:hypothetical protein